MKKKSIKTKLNLNKRIISNLDAKNIKGGGANSKIESLSICPPTFITCPLPTVVSGDGTD